MRVLKPHFLFVSGSRASTAHERGGRETVTCASCGTETTDDRAVRIGIDVERLGEEWIVRDTVLLCPYCADTVAGYADPPSGIGATVASVLRGVWDHPGETTFRLAMLLAVMVVVLLPLWIVWMGLV